MMWREGYKNPERVTDYVPDELYGGESEAESESEAEDEPLPTLVPEPQSELIF